MHGLALVALAVTAACGSSSSTKSDAPSVAFSEVTCPPAPAAEITTNATGTAYMPAQATIASGSVVRFVMPSAHDVTSSSGQVVGFGATKCLMFSGIGTFNFHCSVHGFTGSVSVQ